MTVAIDFLRTNAALISVALLCYCAWRIRQIDKRTAAIRFLLFRDYEEEFSHHDQRTASKPPLRHVS
jgi:hypothetical protein